MNNERREPSMNGAAPTSRVDSESRLEALHLEKSYGSRKVVKDVSLSVRKGEVVGLLGPNGAGKTTSFYMIVGLVRSDAGEIYIDGQSVQNLPIHRRSRLGLSYLPQEASIFRKLNVEENVRETLGICDHAFIISDGHVLAQGTPSEIVDNADVRRVYLGEHFRM